VGAKVIKWRFWLPMGWDAIALYWFILVKPAYINDFKLLEHERVHIQQQKRIGFLRYCFHYLTSADFRRQVETEAYIVQGWSLKAIEEILQEKYYA